MEPKESARFARLVDAVQAEAARDPRPRHTGRFAGVEAAWLHDLSAGARRPRGTRAARTPRWRATDL